MKKRTYKLLSKTTLIYLVFTLTAFLISALFLTHEADEYIYIELERRFEFTERKVKRTLEKNQKIKRKDTEIWHLKNKPANLSVVSYSDTLIRNPDSDNLEIFRKKTFILAHDSSYSKISIVKSISDFYRLRDDIFEALIPAFLILAFSIVLFNYLMSGLFFKPFNRILNHMRGFKVGQMNIDHVDTSTTEFIKMQNLFSDMVERIDEDYSNLKQYTENMAHEIQTPLTVIRNKLENLLTDEKWMLEKGEEIKIIYDETNYLSKLGQSLNLITRIENREFTDAREIKTKAVIEKHLAAIQESFELNKLKVKTNLSAEHKLYLDPVLLDIILKNLIRNAIQYASNVSPIVIESTPATLTISNHGNELPFAKEKLFDRFQRNNNSNKSLGLGLAIVKKICDLNNLVIKYRYSDQQHIFDILEAK